MDTQLKYQGYFKLKPFLLTWKANQIEPLTFLSR
jgi:hypothetical protein